MYEYFQDFDLLWNFQSFFRDKSYEYYVSDRLLLEYALSQHDNCSIKFSGHDFGENLYAFGLHREADKLTVKNRTKLMLRSPHPSWHNRMHSCS